MDRNQAIDGVNQQGDRKPNKVYNEQELDLGDLIEYLHPQMDKFLKEKGPGILFSPRVLVKYNRPLEKDVKEDDEHRWFDENYNQDKADDDMENPVY